MKKLLTVCMMLAALSMIAFASEAKVESKGSVVDAAELQAKLDRLDIEEALQFLEGHLSAAKEAGLEPDPAFVYAQQNLFEQLERIGSPDVSGRDLPPVLDQGSNTCDGAVLVAVPSVTAGTTATGVGQGTLPTCGTSYSPTTGKAVWYKVLGTGRQITVETCTGSSFDTKLSVYCNSCATKTCVGGNDDVSGCGTGAQSRVVFCSVAGAEYLILVHGYSGANGAYTLTVLDGATCTPTVACQSADARGRCCYVLNGVGTCVDDKTSAECGVLSGQWGGANTTCTANPCPVGRCCYTNGTCGDVIQVECAYYGGTWTAGITCATPCPVNVQGGETCANAVPLPGPGEYSSSTADNLDDDPNLWCGSGSANVMYDEWFIVTGTGNTMSATNCHATGVGMDSQIGVYCRDCGALTCVTTNDDMSPACATGNNRSKVTWCTELGRTYYLMVDGWGSSTPGGSAYILTLTDDGVPCSNPVQCDPIARCCYRDNAGALTCEMKTAAQCSELGGQWTAGADCATGCPTGSCCYSVGGDICHPLCQEGLLQSECTVLGGVWTLDGVCGPDACPIDCYCTCSAEANTHCALGPVTIVDLSCETTPDEILIYVPVEYHITDVNVCFDITHAWDSDVDIFLVSPLGTQVELSTDNGGSGDNYHCTILDDESAGGSVTLGVAPFNGSYVPEFPLAGFDGENALGTWHLIACDDEGGIAGVINWACLTFTYDYILPVTGVAFDAVPGNNSITLNWSTASESNMSHFEVLRGANKVAEVACTNSGTTHNYSFVDNDVTNGVAYSYTLVGVALDGSRGELASVNASPNANGAVVTEYALLQNFPNPFNPETNIAFDMVEAGHVNVSIYNVIGQKVAELVNGNMNAGRHIVSFDATNLPSGLYLYKMEANGFSAQKKMVLMK